MTRYEQHQLKYNNPLIPLYFIVEFKGCPCQLENYIGQLQSNIYGIPYFYPSIIGQKMKLKLHGCPTEFINKRGTWVCYCESSQSKIKACIQVMLRLNDIGKVTEIHQFGGKKLEGDKLKDAMQAKGKAIKVFECACPKDETQYKNTKTVEIKDKKEMMANYMFQAYRQNHVEISGNKLTIKSNSTIKMPTQSNINRYLKKFDAIEPGKEEIYYRQQGMLCGFWY